MEDEVLSALSRSDQVEISQIDEALHRIELGTYGTCALCGHQIAPERLKAMSTAGLCISCANSPS